MYDEWFWITLVASPEDFSKSFKPGGSSNSTRILGNHLGNGILELEYAIATVMIIILIIPNSKSTRILGNHLDIFIHKGWLFQLFLLIFSIKSANQSFFPQKKLNAKQPTNWVSKFLSFWYRKLWATVKNWPVCHNYHHLHYQLQP